MRRDSTSFPTAVIESQSPSCAAVRRQANGYHDILSQRPWKVQPHPRRARAAYAGSGRILGQQYLHAVVTQWRFGWKNGCSFRLPREYKEERPKEALGGLTPAECARQLTDQKVVQCWENSSPTATQGGGTSTPLKRKAGLTP
jgi:hypothetical protein